MSLSKIIESNKIVGLEEVDEAEVEAIAQMKKIQIDLLSIESQRNLMIKRVATQIKKMKIFNPEIQKKKNFRYKNQIQKKIQSSQSIKNLPIKNFVPDPIEVVEEGVVVIDKTTEKKNQEKIDNIGKNNSFQEKVMRLRD